MTADEELLTANEHWWPLMKNFWPLINTDERWWRRSDRWWTLMNADEEQQTAQGSLAAFPWAWHHKADNDTQRFLGFRSAFMSVHQRSEDRLEAGGDRL